MTKLPEDMLLAFRQAKGLYLTIARLVHRERLVQLEKCLIFPEEFDTDERKRS